MTEPNQYRSPFCWHLWRRRYYGFKTRGCCEECLKRHPDYWKWKLVLRKHNDYDPV